MAGLSGASSLLLFARSPGGNPSQGGPSATEIPFLRKCSVPGLDYATLDNLNGQDPCQVARALLQGPCLGPNTNIGDSLPVNQLLNNACLCSTVYYSLVNVCGVCTDTNFLSGLTWSEYSGLLQCQNPAIDAFTQPIPSTIPIPQWAFLPLNDDKVNLQSVDSSASAPAATQGSIPSLPPQQPSPSPSGPGSGTGTGSEVPTTSNTGTTASVVVTPSASEPTSSSSTSETSSTADGVVPSTTRSSPPAPATQTELSNKSSTAETQTGVAGSDVFSAKAGTSEHPGQTRSTPGGQVPQSTSTATVASARTGSHLGAIIGGVFGGIAAAALAVFILLFLARRRRRRREKEAMLASGPLDWWRRTDILPRAMKREPSESSTIKADELDDDDDMETLHATSVEKKSVTYGEYPDL